MDRSSRSLLSLYAAARSQTPTPSAESSPSVAPLIPQQGGGGLAPTPPAQGGPLTPPAAEPPPALPSQGEPPQQVQPLIPQAGTLQPQASSTPAPLPQTAEQLDQQFQDALRTKPLLPARSLPLRLTDAVRIALVQNSDIQLGAVDAKSARSALLKATAPFDSSMTLDLEYSRSYRSPSAQAPVNQGDLNSLLASTLTNSLLDLQKNPNADVNSIVSANLNASEAQQRRKADDIYGATAVISKKLRNGFELSLTYKPDFQDQNYNGTWPPSQHVVDVGVSIPLLKLGVRVNGAQEASAQKDYEAALLTLTHTVTKSSAKVVDDYWKCIGSERKLEIADSTYRIAASLLSLTEELVRASAVAKTEVSLAQAKSAEAASARNAALIALFQDVKQLALDLGLREDQLHVLPLPIDPFPPISPSDLSRFNVDRLIDVAMAHRFDRLSALKAIESKRLLAAKARIDLRPTMDLRLQAGLTINDDAYDNVPGRNGYTAKPNWGVSMALSYQPANNFAKSGVVDAEAKLGKAIVNLDTISHAIIVNIRTLDETLRELVEQIKYDEAAVASFQQNLADMREKFRQGASTLIETFQSATNLTNAKNSLVGSQMALAEAVSQLRFESGTILTPSVISWVRPYKRGLDSVKVTPASLTTIPTEWEVTQIPQQPVDPWNHERRKKSNDRGGTY